MKSLKDLVLESSVNNAFKSILDKCEKVQGECHRDDALDHVRAMQGYFNDRYSDKIDLEDFKEEYDEGHYYLIYDDDNYLMCVWDYNKFKAATVQLDGNKGYVNGNLYYSSKEVLEFIANHMSKDYRIYVCD